MLYFIALCHFIFFILFLFVLHVLFLHAFSFLFCCFFSVVVVVVTCIVVVVAVNDTTVLGLINAFSPLISIKFSPHIIPYVFLLSCFSSWQYSVVIQTFSWRWQVLVQPKQPTGESFWGQTKRMKSFRVVCSESFQIM